MLKTLAARPLLAVALAIAAATDRCPYTAASPIADASTTAFDRALAGTWSCVGGTETDAARLKITLTKPTELRVDATDSSDTTTMRFYSAKSGKTQLVNAEDVKTGRPAEWSLIRLSLLRPNVLQMELAMDTPFKADSLAPPKEVVKRSLKRGDLFDDWLVCMRDTKK